jgi:hypothetical protein
MTDLVPVDPRTSLLVHPSSGEVIDPTAPAPDLVAVREELTRLEEEARAVRRAVEHELVRRLDARGKRTDVIDGVKLKTNQPTEDHYNAEELSLALEQAGYGDLAETIAVAEKPKPPALKLDRRVLNAALKTNDRDLLALITRHRRRAATTRKLDVLSKPVDSTAEEVE